MAVREKESQGGPEGGPRCSVRKRVHRPPRGRPPRAPPWTLVPGKKKKSLSTTLSVSPDRTSGIPDWTSGIPAWTSVDDYRIDPGVVTRKDLELVGKIRERLMVVCEVL
ncbi:hypothetical protein KM043_005169 [Ampulex compressa]|nr:hypothetical protein KM043_005169 [Ampulex compressa]